MRTLEEIIKLLNIKTKSKDLKKVLYDKYIRNINNNIINYYILNQYPELISLFEKSNKIDLNKVDWDRISCNQKLSEEFIREFKNKIIWSRISYYQKLSNFFIREFKDKLDWVYISEYQKLSEEFISVFKNDVNWSLISIYQKLSESFITEHKDYVDWYHISKFQKLSKSFIEEHKDYVNLNYISKYQKLSESFISEHNLKLNSNNWLYKDGDYKLEAIRETGLYITDDNYVYGFKGIRSNRYSRYNYQYQYLKGQEYECHADFNNDNSNSFGLSVWTKEEATNYCNELVVEVRIHKDDLSALVHKGGKIRCQKFTILN